MKADVTGSVNLDLTGSGTAGAIDLKGTTLEGDIDIPNKKLHLSFAAPALMSVTGDLILIDQTSYLKVSLITGAKYLQVDVDRHDLIAAGSHEDRG